MPTVDSMIRRLTQHNPGTSFWVLEKDYALSYLLAGISSVESLSNGLALKGGTALRKCYYPDYRCSEDLDLTSVPGLQQSDIEQEVRRAAQAMLSLLEERGPFRIQVDRLTLREKHPAGQDSFTVRVQFPHPRDPVCRLKIEITHDELLLLEPDRRPLQHSFPEPAPKAAIKCYPLEEIAAEKLRALLESLRRLRARGWGASRVCRDYYDLWWILKHKDLSEANLPDLTKAKCEHRGIAVSSPDSFFEETLQVVASREWHRQLCPFVSDCPDPEAMIGQLRRQVLALDW